MQNGKYKHYPFTVYTYDEVDSTNSVAKRAVNMCGAEVDLSVHAAGVQTAGRGRSGRSWLNTDGAIMMSIVQKTDLTLAKIPMLNLVAAAAVRSALIKIAGRGLDLSVKWPNDIVTTERLEKLCGILSEVVRLGRVKYAIIGIGVNLNASSIPGGLLQPATSVFLKTGKTFSVLDVLNVILDEYSAGYELFRRDEKAFLELYSKQCISIGRHVAVLDGDGARYGVGKHIGENGGLIVDFEDGTTACVLAADVSVRSRATIDDALAKSILPPRKPDGNKSDNGRAAIIAGSPKMPGAALMCTKACIRAGAGLTKVLIPKEIIPSFSAVPEAMLETDDGNADDLIRWADALLIGCGMGVETRTAELLKRVLASRKPCVIDADALNTMAREPELLELLHENAVITPHPAEMARLCGCTTDEVLKNFSGKAIDFASRYGCTVLLKSASSIIASPSGAVRYNDSGNSGLSKGGSGDVLAGIVVSMLAQGAKPFDAASLGSYLLGVSAENALDFLHNRFIEATDIADIIGSEIEGRR